MDVGELTEELQKISGVTSVWMLQVVKLTILVPSQLHNAHWQLQNFGQKYLRAWMES